MSLQLDLYLFERGYDWLADGGLLQWAADADFVPAEWRCRACGNIGVSFDEAGHWDGRGERRVHPGQLEPFGTAWEGPDGQPVDLLEQLKAEVAFMAPCPAPPGPQATAERVAAAGPPAPAFRCRCAGPLYHGWDGIRRCATCDQIDRTLTQYQPSPDGWVPVPPQPHRVHHLLEGAPRHGS